MIEGASHGVGLGHEFLRHIERAGIIIHIVEPAPMDGSDPLENYRTIRQELEQYATELGNRPEIVVVSKAELPEAADFAKQLETAIGKPVLLISAVTGVGLNPLMQRVMSELEQHRERPAPLPIRIPPHLRRPEAPVVAAEPTKTGASEKEESGDGRREPREMKQSCRWHRRMRTVGWKLFRPFCIWEGEAPAEPNAEESAVKSE